jgi:membrane associated rhomboid family serine protease
MFNLPSATKALLAANVVIFAVLWILPEARADEVVLRFGFTPGLLFSGWRAIVTPVTYQFLHAGWTHLGVNMLGLVAFGAGIEQRLGWWRYLVFYLICGVAGAFAQFATGPQSPDVMIGASAAISGLFGGILRLAVFRRSLWLIVALWFVANFVAGVSGIGSGGEPVAWIGHIGGFIAGLALYPLFARR